MTRHFQTKLDAEIDRLWKEGIFQEYEEGWEDADALPPNRSVVKNFKKVLEQSSDSILDGWTIFPAANGTLLLEYKPSEAGINIGKDDFSYY